MWARGQVRRAVSAYIGTRLALAISGISRLLTNRIYLDHAATTPVIEPARDAHLRGIAKLANAIVEQSLALADSAKVEAQCGEAAANEGLVEQLHDLVVHRAAGLRMAVEDHRDWCARAWTRLEAAFEATFGTGENDFGHGLRLA